MKSGVKRKLIIFLAVCLGLCLIAGFDYARSRMFHISLVSMDPNPAVADGQTPVTVTLLLTDHAGQPVEGHTLFAISKNGGMFHSQREVTDGKGAVSFIYYPYKASGITELRDVCLSFSDESNSVFIEINTKAEFLLELKKPETTKTDSSLLDGIFGE